MKIRSPLNKRALAVGTVLGSVALIAAACSSSPSGSGSSTTTTTPGVTATKIILGTTTPLTGPAAPGYDQIAPSANAVFQYINAKGGIYGRKIQYLVENDEYDPTLTVQKTRELVQQDNILADVGGLGTPTQLDVENYLNSEGVPQMMVESGCACWSDPSNPNVSGFQPNYIVEGKILGSYVAKHFTGDKIGYLYQDDEFGQDGVKGLNQEIPKSSVVGQQTYEGTAQGLAAGLGTQINALKASGAKVVVLYTIPAATALALLAAAEVGYTPQWVVSSVGADPPTLAGLLSSFSKGKAGASLLNGMISNSYFAPESDASNSWIKLSKSILAKYAPSIPWTGNSEFGAALGFVVVQLLEDAGPHLTRQSLLTTLADKGATIASPGIVPLSYSSSDHYGYSGSEIVKIENSKITPISPVYVTTNTGPITVYRGGQKPIPALFGG